MPFFNFRNFNVRYQVFYCLVMSDGWGDLYHLINLAHPILLKAYPSMHKITPVYMILIGKQRYERCLEILDENGLNASSAIVHVIKTDVSNYAFQHSDYNCIGRNTEDYLQTHPVLREALNRGRLVTISANARQYSDHFLGQFQGHHLGEHFTRSDNMGFIAYNLGVFVPWFDIEKLKSEEIEDEKYTKLVLTNNNYPSWDEFFQKTDIIPCYIPTNLSETGKHTLSSMIELLFINSKQHARNVFFNSNMYNLGDFISLNKKYNVFDEIVYIDILNEKTEVHKSQEKSEGEPKRTLYIANGIFKLKKDYLRLLSHALFIGCGGDTSLQDAIGFGKIPLYLTTKPKKNMLLGLMESIKDNVVITDEEKAVFEPFYQLITQMCSLQEKGAYQFSLDYYTGNRNDLCATKYNEQYLRMIDIKNLTLIFEKFRKFVIKERNVLKKLPAVYVGDGNDTGELLNALMYNREAINNLKTDVETIAQELENKFDSTGREKAQNLRNAYSELNNDPSYDNLLKFLDIVNTHRHMLHLSNKTHTYTGLRSKT